MYRLFVMRQIRFNWSVPHLNNATKRRYLTDSDALCMIGQLEKLTNEH